jgi:hypothetical protein
MSGLERRDLLTSHGAASDHACSSRRPRSCPLRGAVSTMLVGTQAKEIDSQPAVPMSPLCRRGIGKPAGFHHDLGEVSEFDVVVL